MLRQYVRDKQGRPCGVVVSDKLSGEIYFGYSLCNTKKGDKYNREKGLEIAIGRLRSRKMPFSDYFEDIVPQTIINTLEQIKDRSFRYFCNKKNKEILK
jgi:hypothetical protein